MSTCDLQMTLSQIDEIQRHEAVVIREFERNDGSRFGEVVASGDAVEMEIEASADGLFVVPVGIKVVCQSVVSVSSLFRGVE